MVGIAADIGMWLPLIPSGFSLNFVRRLYGYTVMSFYLHRAYYSADIGFKCPVPSFLGGCKYKSHTCIYPICPLLILSVRQAFICASASAKVIVDIAVAGTMCTLLYIRRSATAYRFVICRWQLLLVFWRLSTIVVRDLYLMHCSFGRWQLDCSLGL
jgi:hypothetical protein